MKVKGIVPVAITALVSFRLGRDHSAWYDRCGGQQFSNDESFPKSSIEQILMALDSREED